MCIFNETTLNICFNFIPNKIITCNDKDSPWFNNKIRYFLSKKKERFRQYINNGKLHSDYEKLQFISTTLRDCLKSSKEKHNIQLSTKLNNQSISSKMYWHILKTFVNGRKIPVFRPLLVGNMFVSNFIKS